MPELQIDQKDVDQHSRRAVDYLEALMLWPHDPEMHNASMEAAQAIYFVNMLEKRGGVVAANDAAAMVAKALHARTPENMKEEAERATWHGTVAGYLLHELVARTKTGEPVTMGQLISALNGRFDAEKIRESTINNKILKHYRSVAHLWAAYLGELEQSGSPFPCRRQDLGRFLARAEWWRREGERLKLARSRETFLYSGKTWTAAETLRLPAIQMDFQPLN